MNPDLLHAIIILILIILIIKRILLDKYYTALNIHYHPIVDQKLKKLIKSNSTDIRIRETSDFKLLNCIVNDRKGQRFKSPKNSFVSV